MNNSPTGESVETTGAEISPTSQEQQVQTPAEQTQETISREQSQEAVSDDTANQNQNPQGDGTQKQTQQTGGDSTTDDGLAKFAKSQGVDDVSGLDENAQRFLKIAYDNQKAFRNSKNDGHKITDTTESLGDGSIEAEVAQLKYERETDKFWSQDNRDRSLESSMVDILNEKAEKYGKEYAFNLSRDLDTLYGMAQLKSGGNQPNVDAEAIRREERESIRKQSMAGAPNAHASEQKTAAPQKVTKAWIDNEYDPRNPEHRKLVDAFYAQ